MTVRVMNQDNINNSLHWSVFFTSSFMVLEQEDGDEEEDEDGEGGKKNFTYERVKILQRVRG